MVGGVDDHSALADRGDAGARDLLNGVIAGEDVVLGQLLDRRGLVLIVDRAELLVARSGRLIVWGSPDAGFVSVASADLP